MKSESHDDGNDREILQLDIPYHNRFDIWIDRSGTVYRISEMADSHIFSVMENLIKSVRMQRRKHIAYLEGLVAMYDDTLMGTIENQLRTTIETTLATVSKMNTDAYGQTYVTSFEPIMIEAAARNMRDPFAPDYEKNNANHD